METRGVEGDTGDVPPHWPHRQSWRSWAEHRDLGPDGGRFRASAEEEWAEHMVRRRHWRHGPTRSRGRPTASSPSEFCTTLAGALTTRLSSTPATVLIMALTDAPHGDTIPLRNAEVTEHTVEGLPTIALCARLLGRRQHYRDIAPSGAQSGCSPGPMATSFALVNRYSRLGPPPGRDWQPLPPGCSRWAATWSAPMARCSLSCPRRRSGPRCGGGRSGQASEDLDRTPPRPDALNHARALGRLQSE